MLQPWVIYPLITLALLGDIAVLVLIHRYKGMTKKAVQTFALLSLGCLVFTIGFAFDLLNQIWTVRPSSISEPAMNIFGTAFLLLAALAVAVFFVAARKRRS